MPSVRPARPPPRMATSYRSPTMTSSIRGPSGATLSTPGGAVHRGGPEPLTRAIGLDYARCGLDMPTVLVTSGPLTGRLFALDRELLIGREGADLAIEDPEVSRRHAALRPVGDGVEVEDLGSTNGTFVDGRRIDRSTILDSDSTVSVGSSELSIELDRQPPAEPPAAPPASGAPRTLLRVVAGTAPGMMLPIGDEPLVIGRDQAGIGGLDGDPRLLREPAKGAKIPGGGVVE